MMVGRLLLCLWLSVALLSAAEVTMLDGEQLSGELSWLDAATISVAGRQLALGDVDTIAIAGVPPPVPAAVQVAVLADGSWLPTSIQPSLVADQVTAVLPGGQHIDLELGQILAWGSPAWLLQTAGAQGDRVVLADGEELTGRVRGLRDGAVQLDVPGLGVIDLPILTRLVGLRLAIPTKAADGLHLRLRPLASGPGLALLPRAGGLVYAGLPGQAVVLPPGAVLHVEGGRRLWLSSLDPTLVEEEGAFGVVWPHARDRDLDGNAIVLRGQTYERGLVVHSRARLVWQLDGRFSSLQALAGIADTVGREGDCEVVISGDDRVLWHRPRVRGGEPPEALRLDLSGVQRLELRVELGERYDIGDHFALADAWLLRAP